MLILGNLARPGSGGGQGDYVLSPGGNGNEEKSFLSELPEVGLEPVAGPGLGRPGRRLAGQAGQQSNGQKS